jgi:hypothetical protein
MNLITKNRAINTGTIIMRKSAERPVLTCSTAAVVFSRLSSIRGAPEPNIKFKALDTINV